MYRHVRLERRTLTIDLFELVLCRFRRFLYGLGCRCIQGRKYGHGHQEEQGSRVLDLVFWVCRTSVTQAWKTHVSILGRCQATSQQCLGEWFGRLFGQVHVNLEILKQEYDMKLLFFIMIININIKHDIEK